MFTGGTGFDPWPGELPHFSPRQSQLEMMSRTILLLAGGPSFREGFGEASLFLRTKQVENLGLAPLDNSKEG